MHKLKAGFDFIFSSYKRSALFLFLFGLFLLAMVASSVLKLVKEETTQVLGESTTNGSLLAQVGPGSSIDGSQPGSTGETAKPNLYMGKVHLRKNALSAAFPNGNCSNGTLVTEGMTLTPGEVIEVCVEYGNNGTVSSGVFNMDNYIHKTAQPAPGTRGYQSYPIGAAPVSNNLATQLGSIVPDPSVCSTNCHAGVFIDSDNQVSESNESDNFAQSVGYNVAGSTTTTTTTDPTPTPTCTPRPGGLDGFIDNNGTIGIAGGTLPPGGYYCPNVAPTTTAATIEPVPVIANGTGQYKIKITSSDPQGGISIFTQYVSINNPEADASQGRGLLGWSARNFQPYWNGNIKTGTTPIACSPGGGKVGIFGGADYGPQYVNVISCSTSSSANTRTTEIIVSFNTNFTTPASNKLYAFTDDAGQLYSGWKDFQTFSVTDPCQYKTSGDANCDLKVNNTDFDLWKTDFLAAPNSNPPASLRADFNSDNKVNTDDFNIWRAGNFNQNIPH